MRPITFAIVLAASSILFTLNAQDADPYGVDKDPYEAFTVEVNTLILEKAGNDIYCQYKLAITNTLKMPVHRLEALLQVRSDDDDAPYPDVPLTVTKTLIPGKAVTAEGRSKIPRENCEGPVGANLLKRLNSFKNPYYQIQPFMAEFQDGKEHRFYY
ncbi:MAG: hypothetical protein JXA20_10015 [Spirochaetes bacterium]|nr:hypothetical protein [Spirochaetota bacterium]